MIDALAVTVRWALRAHADVCGVLAVFVSCTPPERGVSGWSFGRATGRPPFHHRSMPTM